MTMTAQQTLSAPPGAPSKHRLAYEAYIRSSKWERRRLAYYSRHPRVCRACKGIDKIHLHHHTYKRLGMELDEDLVPLCEDCHRLVHEIDRDHRSWSLTKATVYFLELNEATLRQDEGKRSTQGALKGRRRRAKARKSIPPPRVKKSQMPRPYRLQRTDVAPPVPPEPLLVLADGDRVRLIINPERKRNPISWAIGKSATVREILGPSSWRVEVDGMPGSRMAVNRAMVEVIPRGKDPVNETLGTIRQNRREDTRARTPRPGLESKT